MSEEFEQYSDRHRHRRSKHRVPWQRRNTRNDDDSHWESYGRSYSSEQDSNDSYHPVPLPQNTQNFFNPQYMSTLPSPWATSSGSVEPQQRMIEYSRAIIQNQLQNRQRADYDIMTETEPTARNSGEDLTGFFDYPLFYRTMQNDQQEYSDIVCTSIANDNTNCNNNAELRYIDAESDAKFIDDCITTETEPVKKSKKIKLIRPASVSVQSAESNVICPTNSSQQSIEYPTQRWKSLAEKKFFYDVPSVVSESNDIVLDYEEDTELNDSMQNDSSHELRLQNVPSALLKVQSSNAKQICELDAQIDVLLKKREGLFRLLSECYEEEESYGYRNNQFVASSNEKTDEASSPTPQSVSANEIKKAVNKGSSVNGANVTDGATTKSVRKYSDQIIVEEAQNRAKKMLEDGEDSLMLKRKFQTAINNVVDMRSETKMTRKKKLPVKVQSVIKIGEKKLYVKKNETLSAVGSQRNCRRRRNISKASVPYGNGSDTNMQEEPNIKMNRNVATKKRSKVQRSNVSFNGKNKSRSKNKTKKQNIPHHTDDDITSNVLDLDEGNDSDLPIKENNKEFSWDYINNYRQKYALKDCSVVLDYTLRDAIIAKFNSY